jgi:hypothetical protein
MGICPAGDAHRSGRVDNDIRASTRFADRCAMGLIPQQPSVEMHFGGQQITFAAIALLMREHQIMREIARIA